MKEPFICEYCGHEFYARGDVDRQCCSVDCAMSIRHINLCQNKVTMTPVDVYLHQNKTEENYDNDEVNALATAMSIEEYDDVYGVDDGLSVSTPRGDVYHEMNKHVDAIIVLYECPHKTTYTKHRHHPDYNKPLQIELLCRRCHFARHKDQIKEAFNIPFSGINTRLLAAQAAHNSITPAGQSVAQNSLGIASSTVGVPSITTSQAGELRSASNLIAV